MKLVNVSSVMVALALVLSTQKANAQNPAVSMTQGSPIEMVNVALKNLGGAPLAVGTLELQVFDQASCKLLCSHRVTTKLSIKSCQTNKSQVRCTTKLPAARAGYIYFLRVLDGSGTLLTENWLFASQPK